MSAVACISANRLGALPVGWLVKPIGELAVIATGNTPPTADASNYGDDFLFASPADIDDSKWIHQTGKRLSRKGFSLARPFPAKSVLFVCIGSTIGKCAIASVELTSNQQINAVFPSEHLDSEFLYYSLLMAAPCVKEQAGEQAVPLVNKTQFSGTLIAVPKLSEQRAIASTLSDVDALIAGLEKLIAKKRDLKQAAMQQLLTGQTRLPGFSGEWESKTLGSVFEITAGKSKSAYVIEGGNFVICDMGSVSVDGRLITSKRTNYRGDFLAKGDLVMPKDDIGGGKIIGRVGYVDASEKYVLGDHVYRLHAREGDPLFFCYLINHNSINSALRKKVIGSAQLGLGRRSVEEQEIPFPSPVEQTAIACVLFDIDRALVALEFRLAKTRDLKQGMMQELLTGRTRLV